MKSDRSKVLFDAITGIDEDLIDEAASPSRLHPARPILRVAAIAAVIALLMTALLWPTEENYVTSQNTLKVYACEMNNTSAITPDESTLLNGVSTVSWHCLCDPLFSANTYLPFTLSFPDDLFPGEKITFDIYADFADLWRYERSEDATDLTDMRIERFGKNATIPNHSTINWECGNAEHLRESIGDQGYFYISIVIRADNQIVGYGLISLQLSTDPVLTAKTVSCVTVSFPAIEGKKQNVHDRYVWNCIEELKHDGT